MAVMEPFTGDAVESITDVEAEVTADEEGAEEEEETEEPSEEGVKKDLLCQRDLGS